MPQRRFAFRPGLLPLILACALAACRAPGPAAAPSPAPPEEDERRAKAVGQKPPGRPARKPLPPTSGAVLRVTLPGIDSLDQVDRSGEGPVGDAAAALAARPASGGGSWLDGPVTRPIEGPAPCPSEVPGAPAPADAAATPASLPAPVADVAPGRAVADRPDEAAAPMFHLVYVVPQDGEDRRHDVDGLIAAAVDRLETWSRGQIDGRTFRFDRAGGRPDVSFFRSRHDAATLADAKTGHKRLMDELWEAGFAKPSKRYGMVYEGPTDATRVGIAGGRSAIVYLGQVDGLLAEAPTSDGINRFDSILVHELLHSIGAVDACATNFQDHHVADDLDVMHPSGGVIGRAGIDPGRDDYYRHGREGCFDLARSPFLDPLPPDALPFDASLPLTFDPGPDAAQLVPAAPSVGPTALAAAEDEALRVLLAAWPPSAGAPPRPEPGIRAAARRLAREASGAAPYAPPGLGPAAGFFGDLDFKVANTALPACAPAATGLGDLAPALRTIAGQLARPTWPPTRVAIGFHQDGGTLRAAAAASRSAFEVGSVRLGAGPLGTRTFVARLRRRPGATPRKVLAFLCTGPTTCVGTYVTPVPGDDWFEIALSLAPGQVYRVRLAPEQPDGSWGPVTDFLDGIDLTRSPEEALAAMLLAR